MVHGKLAYFSFWSWFLLVTFALGVTVVYSGIGSGETITTINEALKSSLGLAIKLNFNDDAKNYLGIGITMILTFLLWWRVVKVLVLMGSPISWYMHVSMGRQDDGKTGRPVSYMHLGNNSRSNDIEPKLYYGAVFRAHPTSDKLVRSRLEYLVLALPFQRVLLIHESRLFVKKLPHHQRWDDFIRVFGEYLESSETMKPDRFRKELTDAIKKIANHFNRNQNRIDGLNWHMYFGGGSSHITDDFGQQISFDRMEDGKFKITQLGPNGDQEKTVNSIQDVRAIAKVELIPVL